MKRTYLVNGDKIQIKQQGQVLNFRILASHRGLGGTVQKRKGEAPSGGRKENQIPTMVGKGHGEGSKTLLGMAAWRVKSQKPSQGLESKEKPVRTKGEYHISPGRKLVRSDKKGGGTKTPVKV